MYLTTVAFNFEDQKRVLDIDVIELLAKLGEPMSMILLRDPEKKCIGKNMKHLKRQALDESEGNSWHEILRGSFMSFQHIICAKLGSR